MKEIEANVRDNVCPDFLASPHIVGELIDLVTGRWQPDTSHQKQWVAHFVDCPYCRITLLMLLEAGQKVDRSGGYPESPSSDLLKRFIAIHHEIEATYEYIGAFAEAIVAEGREEADKRFPILSEHVRRCRSCKSALEDTLAFLNEPEETAN